MKMKIKLKTVSKSITKAFRKTYDNLFAHTYIHGFQFLSNESQPSSKLIDKIFWTIVISVMLLFTGFACDLFLIRFNENSLKNYIETDQMSIGFVPFPAITICPTQKIISSKLDAIIQDNNLEDLNLTLLRKSLNYVGFNTRKYARPISNAEINVITTFMAAAKLNTLELMKMISYSCNELLVQCRWEGVIISCEKLFTRSTSYEGFCCSFNYDDEHRISSTPIKTNYFGITNGLSFAINIPNISDKFTSSVYGPAVKVLIHKPQSYASYIVPEVIIANNTESIIYLQPHVIMANEEVKALPLPNRNCYLTNELELEYFEFYSFENCVVECIMNRIYELCSCVPYFFPIYTNLTVCDETAINCFYSNIDVILHIKPKDENVDECQCLLTCNKLSYPYNLQTTTFISPKYTIDPFYTGLNETHTVVHVSMAKQTMRLSKTELSLNWIQLIANIGGVVSLFTGVSIISLTHLLYFVTVKWILNIREEYKRSKMIKNRVRFRQRLGKFEKY